jgi:hypothetical protein
MGLGSKILLIVICMLLLVITWQDFKTRTVHVYVFVLLFLSLCLLEYIRCGFCAESFIHVGFNTSAVCLQLLIAYLYLKVIRRINFFDGIGLGDIFFYICAIPVLSAPLFMIYNIGSLMLALLAYIAAGKKLQIESTSIPLAGIQAFTLMFTIIIFEGFFSTPILGTCFLFSL